LNVAWVAGIPVLLREILPEPATEWNVRQYALAADASRFGAENWALVYRRAVSDGER
jgi:hypothetical protein